jgi:uncharacterized glyoxalase superfamily protein PhnB
MTKPLPPEASWLSPYLTVKDVTKAVAFYKQAFQFIIKTVVPDEKGVDTHAEMYYRDQFLMCGKEGAHGSNLKAPQTSGIPCPITLYLYTDNIDEFYQAALKQGAQSISAPENMFWGDRMCRLQDPDAYIWCFATYLGENEKNK